METKFTIKEAAKKSGMSEPWWRMKVLKKEVRYMKIGRRIFIPESTIEQLIQIIEPESSAEF